MPAFRLILLVLFSAQVVLAQEPEPEQDQEPAVVPQELPAKIAAGFNERLTKIALQKISYHQLAERLDESEGLMANVLGARVDAVWTEIFSDTITLARDASAKHEEGFEVTAIIDELADDLQVIPGQAIDAMKRLRANVSFPTADLEPYEFVIADQKLLQATQKVDSVFGTLITYLDISDTLELDKAVERDSLVEGLEDSAANRSYFLQLTLDDVVIMRAAAAALPGDAAVIARLAVMEARVQVASRSLQAIIALMVRMDLQVSQYRQQVLIATGELTADVLHVGVIAGLIKEWSTLLAKLAVTKGPQLVFQLIIVVLILFLFSRLSRVVHRLTDKALTTSKIRLSALLREMIVATARNLVVILGVLIALSQLGVSLGPLLAGLGIAGFIIGFALQDTLSNFASGMLILIYRPFDVGDFVEAGGVRGTVSHMSIVNTTFKTIDNQVLVVPNNMIWSSVITNVTAQRTRRVDLEFTVSYSDDLDKVEQVLNSVIESHDAVLDEPAPAVKLHELGDSGVMFVVRPWVKTEDYWPTYSDSLRAVRDRFDAVGITIPFPQHDVHVVKT